jgi:hypothetical protein
LGSGAGSDAPTVSSLGCPGAVAARLGPAFLTFVTDVTAAAITAAKVIRVMLATSNSNRSTLTP